MIQTKHPLVHNMPLVQGDYPHVYARVVQEDGSQIVVASVSAVSYRVWDISLCDQIGDAAAVETTSGAVALTPGTVWSDTYSTANPWPDKGTAAEVGYNFHARLDAQYFEAEGNGPSQFLVEITATVGGELLRVGRWLMDVVDSYSRP